MVRGGNAVGVFTGSSFTFDMLNAMNRIIGGNAIIVTSKIANSKLVGRNSDVGIRNVGNGGNGDDRIRCNSCALPSIPGPGAIDMASKDSRTNNDVGGLGNCIINAGIGNDTKGLGIGGTDVGNIRVGANFATNATSAAIDFSGMIRNDGLASTSTVASASIM